MTSKAETDNIRKFPTSRRSYVIDGKLFDVTAHFTGDKDLNEIVKEIAVTRAERETGLP